MVANPRKPGLGQSPELWYNPSCLVSDWTGGTQDVGTWNAEVMTCDTEVWVWCVQDHSVHRLFLPVVSKG